MLVGASALPAPLPPPPALNEADLQSVTISEALTPTDPSAGAIQPPSMDPETPWSPTAATDALPGPSSADGGVPRAQVEDYLLGEGVSPEDLRLPVFEFLEKYPAFRAEVAKLTGIPAFGQPVYDFTAREKATMLAKIVYSQYKSPQPPQWYTHAELMAEQGTRVPLTHTPFLVIDDDGSENNGGPGLSIATTFWALTNQTQMLTDSLTNKSIAYDLYVRPYGGAFPTFATLMSYDQVVYVTGQNIFTPGDLTATRRLEGYLDDGGDLWMLGSMIPFHYDGAYETDTER
jgi:hypothetical protein